MRVLPKLTALTAVAAALVVAPAAMASPTPIPAKSITLDAASFSGQLPAPGATLTRATVFFHTNDEDKDHDTHITVTAFDRNGTTAARVANAFGDFDDHSDNGPFGMYIHNPSRWELLQGGNLHLRIDPNGNDTWRFNFRVDLQFSDGSQLSSWGDRLQLSQSDRARNFPIF
ncbi:hypothetical protein [Crossiella sp. NPDC003009]